MNQILLSELRKWYFNNYLKLILPKSTEEDFLVLFENGNMDPSEKQNLETKMLLMFELVNRENELKDFIRLLKETLSDYYDFYLSVFKKYSNLPQDEMKECRTQIEGIQMSINEIIWDLSTIHYVESFLKSQIEPIKRNNDELIIKKLIERRAPPETIEKAKECSISLLQLKENGITLINNYKDIQYKFNLSNLDQYSNQKYLSIFFPNFPPDFLELLSKNIDTLVKSSLSKNKPNTLLLLSGFAKESFQLIMNQQKTKINDLPSSDIALGEIPLDFVQDIKNDASITDDQKILKIISKISGLDGSNFVQSSNESFSKWEEKCKKQDIKSIIYSIIKWYESYCIVSGVFTGLFDNIEGTFDKDIQRSYLSSRLYTNVGLYSKERNIVNAKGKPVSDKKNRKNLQTYLEAGIYPGIKKLFEWLIRDVKEVRDSLHEGSLTEQKEYDHDEITIRKGENSKNIPFETAFQFAIQMDIIFKIIVLKISKIIELEKPSF